MQTTAKSRAGSGQGERTDSMIAVSASKLSSADLNNLMRALEIDVVALGLSRSDNSHRFSPSGQPGLHP